MRSMQDPSLTASRPTHPAPGRVVVLAPPTAADHIARALEGVPVTLRSVTAAPLAATCITEDTLAIVAAPADDQSPESLLEALAADERTAARPVLLVVEQALSAAQARALHAAGAAVVLAWPAEVRLLPGLLLSLRRSTLAARREQSADVALDEAVVARIAVDATPAELSCRVVDGTAILRGRTDSPWRARRLRDLVANVPGVERVEDHALEVVPPEVPDEELERTVRDVIRSALGDAAATVAVEVHAGAITLTGTLDGPAELRMLETVVENVPGVVGLELHIVVPHDAPSPAP
jgi:osmotically-inducible protein OsmY